MPTCPHCGHETDAGAGECPLCGTPLTGRSDGPARPPSAGDEAASAEGPVPWEEPGGSVFGGLLESWTMCLFEPERFFARVDPAAPIARALLYYLVITAVSGFFSILWQGVVQAYLGVPAGGAGGSPLLLSFFLTPLLFLFVLVVGGALVHVSALLVAGSGARGAKATYRVVCYSASPLLLTAVPVLGNMFAPFWSLVVMVVGLRVTHRTNTGRAVIAVLAPLALVVLAVLVLLVLTLSSAELAELYGPVA